jgi:hypothetical protein
MPRENVNYDILSVYHEQGNSFFNCSFVDTPFEISAKKTLPTLPKENGC